MVNQTMLTMPFTNFTSYQVSFWKWKNRKKPLS
nr:MAG TPA: hypothetical protein [Caudoviricetes sp.]DAP85902.1 MAG TPA: hypothetical protein [Caudoviricetes sp.]